MKTRINNIVTALFVSCGILMLFFSVNMCENGKTDVKECFIDCAFGLTMILTGLVYKYISLLTEENRVLRNEIEKQIEAVTEVPTGITWGEYKKTIHTPISEDEIFPEKNKNEVSK